MVRVPGFLREGAVAGEEEIWSIVAGCGPHLVFKTAELMLSGSEFPVTGGIQTEVSVRAIVGGIPALGMNLGPSKVDSL